MQKKFVVNASKNFLKEIDELPTDIALEVTKALKILEFSPLPSGTRLVKKLKGFIPPLYRLRVGYHSVLYRIAGNEVAVLKVIDRKELERELKRMLG